MQKSLLRGENVKCILIGTSLRNGDQYSRTLVSLDPVLYVNTKTWVYLIKHTDKCDSGI